MAPCQTKKQINNLFAMFLLLTIQAGEDRDNNRPNHLVLVEKFWGKQGVLCKNEEYYAPAFYFFVILTVVLRVINKLRGYR